MFNKIQSCKTLQILYNLEICWTSFSLKTPETFWAYFRCCNFPCLLKRRQFQIKFSNKLALSYLKIIEKYQCFTCTLNRSQFQKWLFGLETFSRFSRRKPDYCLFLKTLISIEIGFFFWYQLFDQTTISQVVFVLPQSASVMKIKGFFPTTFSS